MTSPKVYEFSKHIGTLCVRAMSPARISRCSWIPLLAAIVWHGCSSTLAVERVATSRHADISLAHRYRSQLAQHFFRGTTHDHL
jgi:hypothetical protein